MNTQSRLAIKVAAAALALSARGIAVDTSGGPQYPRRHSRPG